LGIGRDDVFFDTDECSFSDNQRLHFEAAARMSVDDRHVVSPLLEGVALRQDAKCFARSEYIRAEQTQPTSLGRAKQL
jgi:hypothetical protein